MKSGCQLQRLASVWRSARRRHPTGAGPRRLIFDCLDIRYFMVHLLFRPAAACSRAHPAIQIQKNSVGIHIQHALELPHYVGVELGNSLLLRGSLGVRRVGDDGGHFSGRAPKPEGLKNMIAAMIAFSWCQKTEKPASLARRACGFAVMAIVHGEQCLLYARANPSIAGCSARFCYRCRQRRTLRVQKIFLQY